MKKQHAPIKQLLKAGEEARQQLIKRGLASTENLVMRTQKEYPGLVLPGIPSYLPYKWTITDCQRIMYDLLKMWAFKNKDDDIATERLSDFVVFAIEEMNKIENTSKKKMETQKGLLKYLKKSENVGKILEPIAQQQITSAITKFFVDSFAIGIVANGEATTTTEFAEFFFDWTNKLYKIWEVHNDTTSKETTKEKSN